MIDWHRVFEIAFLINLGLQVGMSAMVLVTYLPKARSRRRWLHIAGVAHSHLAITTLIVARYLAFQEDWTIPWMVLAILPMLASDVCIALMFLDHAGLFPRREVA